MHHDVTRLLDSARAGDADAMNQLVPLVYDELHRMAHAQRARLGASETLNTTALVHEAYAKLSDSETDIEGRKHFFRLASRVMRSVIVDRARASGADKRGGDKHHVTLHEQHVSDSDSASDVIALDEALTRLGLLNERQAEVVQLRYFVGFTIPETADVLGISPATVKREWTVARAWLHSALAA